MTMSLFFCYTVLKYVDECIKLLLFSISIRYIRNYYFFHLRKYRIVSLRPILFQMLQITDFFNVADFDIPGYTLPKIVTEMHLYAWSCAIDYRFNFLFIVFVYFYTVVAVLLPAIVILLPINVIVLSVIVVLLLVTIM